jgi:hypothetical protein
VDEMRRITSRTKPLLPDSESNSLMRPSPGSRPHLHCGTNRFLCKGYAATARRDPGKHRTPTSAAEAAPRLATRPRFELPGGERVRIQARVSKQPPTRGPRSLSLPIFGTQDAPGKSRKAASSWTGENAEPPVFSIFFDTSSLSDDPPLSTAPNTQIPAEADVSTGIRRAVCAVGRRPPTTGEGALRRPGGECRGPYGINALVGFSACRVPLRDAILPVSCRHFDAFVDGSPPRRQKSAPRRTLRHPGHRENPRSFL